MVQHRDISYIFMLSSWYLGKSHRPKFIQRHVGLHQSDPSYSGSVCTSKIVALREESLSGKKKFMFFFLSCSKWPFLHSFPRIYEKFKEDVSYHVFWVNVKEINEPVSKKFIGSSRYLSVRACQRRTRKSQKLTHAQNMHYCIYL